MVAKPTSITLLTTVELAATTAQLLPIPSIKHANPMAHAVSLVLLVLPTVMALLTMDAKSILKPQPNTVDSAKRIVTRNMQLTHQVALPAFAKSMFAMLVGEIAIKFQATVAKLTSTWPSHAEVAIIAATVCQRSLKLLAQLENASSQHANSVILIALIFSQDVNPM